ncbi:MAG: DUF3638 domain-containing protein [Proteobacteria bacterium]|nr:DUF3638 domain-containing protein [Pseudomonadota bacterium]
MTLSLKLFSLINNDAHLTGARNLEGYDYEGTISSLNEFIHDSIENKTQLPQELLKIINEEALITKLNNMLTLEKEIKALNQKLIPLSEEERDNAYLETATPIAKNILALQAGVNSVLFPGGWRGKPGHAMVYEFKKNEAGDLLFLVYNSGSGLEHHQRAKTTGKERFHVIKAYQIPKADLSQENMAYFIAELTKPKTEYSLPDTTFTKNRRYDADRLYFEIFPKIAYLNAQEIDLNKLDKRLQEIITIGQRAGTCAEKCLHELIKTAMPNDGKAQQLLFFYKKNSIEKFYKENKLTMDNKKAEQINLAIENLARIIEKNPALFSNDTIKDTFNKMHDIKEAISTNTPKPKQKEINFTIQKISNSQPIQISEQGSLLSVKDSENEIVLPFKAPINIQPLIENKFSQDIFNQFLGNIGKIEGNDYTYAKQNLENIFLHIPLTKDYFSSLDNPQKAAQFISSLTKAIRFYGMCCENLDPAQKASPKIINTLLSTIGIINEITNLQNCTALPGLTPLLGDDFSNLIQNLIQNPFISNKDSAMDARLYKIYERNKIITAKLTNNLDKLRYYTELMLSYPNANQLKEFLYELFKHAADQKFKKDEILSIKNKDKIAEVAMLCLLDKTILDALPASLAQQAKDLNISLLHQKLLLERQIEKVCQKIFSTLNTSCYEYLINEDKSNEPLIKFDTKKDLIQYNSLLDFSISLDDKFGQDLFEDQKIYNVLSLHFGNKTKDQVSILLHPNYIYCNLASMTALKENISEQAIVNCQQQRMLWHLRSSPKSQILNTLEYFKQNPQLLSNKDYQQYLLLNLFQTSLIDEGLTHINDFYTTANGTLDYLVDFFKNDPSPNLLTEMYQLSFLFNQYVLNSTIQKNQLNAASSLTKLKETLNKQKNEHHLRLNLEIALTINNFQKEKDQDKLTQTLTMLLSDYLAYTTYYNAKPNPLKMKEHEKIQNEFLMLAAKHKDVIKDVCYTWLTQQYPDNSLIFEDKFPIFVLHNVINTTMICLDLKSGTIWENGQQKCALPSNLSTNPIYTQFFSNKDPKITSTLVSYPNESGTYRKFTINNKEKATYFETPHLKKPFVLHTTKIIQNKERNFELINIVSKDDANVANSNIGAKKIMLNLPKTFFCETSRAWNELTNQSILIERQNNRYLLDNDKILYELDAQGDKSGFELINLKSLSAQDPLLNLYKIFQEFEDVHMIEIFAKKATESDNQVKISFPRYGLNLIAQKDKHSQQWVIKDEAQPTRILCQDQTCPIVGYDAPLFFTDIETNDTIAYVPNQDFYVKQHKKQNQTSNELHGPLSKKKARFEQGGEESSFATVYYHLSPDINNQAKARLIDEIIEPNNQNRKKILNPKSPWKYTKSEAIIPITYDKKTGDFKASTSQEALMLAYINLAQHQGQRAFQYLQDIIKGGGLKGTEAELSLIEKIVHATPRFPEQALIKNPFSIAVQTCALSLLVHYLAYNPSISVKNIENAATKTERAKAAQSERLINFQATLAKQALHILQEYHSFRNNIPQIMQISTKQEYELLQYIFKETPPTGVLGVRVHQLKAQYHERFWQQSDNITWQPKKEKLVMFDTIKNNEFFRVAVPEAYEHTSKSITLAQLKNAFASPAQQMTLPYPGISDRIFAENMAHYFTLAVNKESIDSFKLTEFCENTILAHSALPVEKQDSLQFVFSCLLLVIMKNRAEFNKLGLAQLETLFYKANLAPFVMNRRNFSESTHTATITHKPTSLAIKTKPISVIASNFNYPMYQDSVFRKEAQLQSFVLEVEKLNQEMQQTIDALIAKKYPQQDYYLDREKALSTLDYEIGSLIHENRDKLKGIFNKFLRNLNERKQILTIAEQKRIAVQNTKKKVSQEMLELARRGPANDKEALLFNLQLLGKTRKTLEINDLQRLYVLSDLNEYQKITGLDEAKAKELHQKISDFVELSILEQQYTNRTKILQNLAATQEIIDDNALVELGNALVETNICDFATEPQMQFFQMAQGMLIYPSRKEFIQELLKPEQQNIVVQPKMGGGKTKVISPLVNVCKADGSNLVIYQVKKSLFETNYQDANATSLKLFNQEAVPFEFDRNVICNATVFKSIYKNFKLIITDKNYLITTGESLQALELKYIELLLAPPSITDKVFYHEWQKQIKWLDKSLQLLKSRGVRLIDEIHDELDPKKRLNYTLGKPESVVSEDIQLQVKLFEFIATLKMNDKILFHDILSGKKNISDHAKLHVYIQEIANALTTSPLSPIYFIIQKLKLDPSKQEMLAQYLLDKKDNIMPEFKPLSDREKDDLAFIKLQLSSILPHTLSRNLFEHYGPSFNPSKGVVEKHLPIPYADNNSPNESSQFGHYIESMNYATQMAYQRGFSDELVNDVITQFLDKAALELIETPTLPFDKTLTAIYFNDQFKGVDLYKIIKDNQYRQMAISQLKQNKQFMQYALANQVLGKILINPQVIESNAVNAVSMTKTTQGMTGTPNNVRAMHRWLKFFEKSGLGIDGQTTALIKRKKPGVIPLKDFTSVETFLSQCQRDENLRVIVDVGALFKGITNEQVAQELAQFYKNDPKLKYILYFDTVKKRLHALNIKNGTPILLNSTDEKTIAKILKCSPEERFTYYDQANATGIDIVQGKSTRAIVTVSDKTTRSKLYQGIRRLRQVDEAQTFSLAFPNALKDKKAFAAMDSNQIVDYTKQNEINEMLELHLMGSQFNFHDIIRENLLSKIYQSPDPQIKSRLLKHFKPFFVNEFRPRHFMQAGSITALIEAQKYFTQLENEFYHSWQSMLQAAMLPITTQESTYIKNQLKSATETAFVICDHFIKSSSAKLGIGAAVEVENKTNVATKIESNTSIALNLNTLEIIPTQAPNPVISSTSPSAILFDIQSHTRSVNEQLMKYVPNLPIVFSDQLHFSKAFSQTIKSQASFFDIFTKNTQTIMMISKKKPPFLTQAVILNNNEADYELYKDLSNELNYVWFINPAGTILGGTPPPNLPKDYSSLLEQIRYLNGDCKLLANQKMAFDWLDQDKLNFLESHIIPIHPDQFTSFAKLKTRVSIINKIIRRIMENPGEDYRHRRWELEFPGFSKLSDKEINLIQQFAAAYYQMNKLDFNPDAYWLQGFPPEITPQIKYGLNEVKFKQSIIEGLGKGRMLQELCSDNTNITFKFHLPSGGTLANDSIYHYQVHDFEFILQHDFSLFYQDKSGKNALDAIIIAYQKDSLQGDELLKVIVKYCRQNALSHQEKEAIISYFINHHQNDIAKRLLNLLRLSGQDFTAQNNELASSIKDLNLDNELRLLCSCMNFMKNSKRIDLKYIHDLTTIRMADLNFYRSNDNMSFIEVLLNCDTSEDEIIALLTPLLQKGLDPNLTFSDGTSPLMQSIKYNQSRLTALLISHGADINFTHLKLSPLSIAFNNLSQTNLNQIVYLLKNGAKPLPLSSLPHRDNLDSKEEQWAYHLFETLQTTSFNDFQDKFKENIDKHLMNNETIDNVFKSYGVGWFDFNYLTKEGRTPLQTALVDMNFENIAFILQHNIDFNLTDINGNDTLDYILDLYCKDPDAALKVLPYFIKYAREKLFNSANPDKNLLLFALKHNQIEVFKQLYAWCGFSKKQFNEFSEKLEESVSITFANNPSILAVYHEETAKLENLFKKFSNLDAKHKSAYFFHNLDKFFNQIKETPLPSYYFNAYNPPSKTSEPILHYLISSPFIKGDRLPYISKLIQLGFDINFKNEANKTALDLAIEKNDVDVVAFLLKNNALTTKPPATEVNSKISALLKENTQKKQASQKRQHITFQKSAFIKKQQDIQPMPPTTTATQTTMTTQTTTTTMTTTQAMTPTTQPPITQSPSPTSKNEQTDEQDTVKEPKQDKLR